MDQSKRRRWLHVPSPAMIVACVALFVAMGGTSYAAVTLAANSVGTKQLKSGAVTTAKIKSGAVTPAKVGKLPGARVRRTAAVSIPSGGGSTVVSYDAVDFNVRGVYNASKPTKMTAPVAGRYLIVATARWNANTSGRRTLALAVDYGNGTPADFRQIARSSVSPYYLGSTLYPEQTVQAVYKLKAGDYVEVWAFQDSGSPVDLQVGTDNGVTFSMQWIAP
jgi:hypothetical protein